MSKQQIYLLNYLVCSLSRIMLIISKVFTILCLLCLCGNMEYPGSFQNIYPLNYLLHMEVILTIIKVFIILFLFCLWEQGIPWEFSKQISKLSFQLSFQIYSLLAQTEEERTFLDGGCKKGDHIVRLSSRALVSPFVKFEIILPLHCFLSAPHTNKHCKTWSSMINLWIDFTTCQK